MPAWLAVNAQVPALRMVTVLPLTVHTPLEVLANTTGWPEAPPLAAREKVPLGLNTGAVGLLAKPVMACVAWPMATFSVTSGAAE